MTTAKLTQMENTAEWKTNLTVFCASFLLLLPFFFINYRLLAFNTVPFDDYASFILSMDGKLPSFKFYSPTGYRFAYFGLGFIIYKTVPYIGLSLLDVSNNFYYFKAIQALSLTSFMFTQFFFFTVFLYGKYKLQKSNTFSLALASICLLLSMATNFYLIDPSIYFYATLLLLFIKKKSVFYLLLLLSVFVNEKISIIFFLFFTMDAVVQKSIKKQLEPIFFSLMALAIYFFMRSILRFPGYENQTDPSLFFESLAKAYPTSFHSKGFI